jgi:hypothetical protein
MTRHYVVPGRIELVGKHVDYAGGRSLTCAVDLALTAHVARTRAAVVRVHDVGRRGVVEVPLMAGVERTHGSARWSSYVVAVARRFARDFPHARTGVDMRLSSTLPRSAGLSSSSALVVALATALVDANDMEHDAHWREAVPDRIARGARWLRQPDSRLVRIPVALLLIVGGVFSFLPVLGLWMLPLGLALIAVDVPAMRPPLARVLRWIEQKLPGQKPAPESPPADPR